MEEIKETIQNLCFSVGVGIEMCEKLTIAIRDEFESLTKENEQLRDDKKEFKDALNWKLDVDNRNAVDYINFKNENTKLKAEALEYEKEAIQFLLTKEELRLSKARVKELEVSEKIRDYKNGDNKNCPYCNSQDIGILSQDVDICNSCNKSLLKQ